MILRIADENETKYHQRTQERYHIVNETVERGES